MCRSQAQHTPGVLFVGNKRTETLSFDHAKPPPPKGRMVSSIGSIEDHAKLWKLVCFFPGFTMICWFLLRKAVEFETNAMHFGCSNLRNSDRIPRETKRSYHLEIRLSWISLLLPQEFVGIVELKHLAMGSFSCEEFELKSCGNCKIEAQLLVPLWIDMDR